MKKQTKLQKDEKRFLEIFQTYHKDNFIGRMFKHRIPKKNQKGGKKKHGRSTGRD